MKTIKFGGKDRPVHYGVNALADFNLATGTDFGWIFNVASDPQKIDFDQVRQLVFMGLKHGILEQGGTIDFSLEDVGRWLDKEFSVFPEFIVCLSGSLPSRSSSD